MGLPPFGSGNIDLDAAHGSKARPCDCFNGATAFR